MFKRVCDRCGKQLSTDKPDKDFNDLDVLANGEPIFAYVDLCENCKAQILQLLKMPQHSTTPPAATIRQTVIPSTDSAINEAEIDTMIQQAQPPKTPDMLREEVTKIIPVTLPAHKENPGV